MAEAQKLNAGDAKAKKIRPANAMEPLVSNNTEKRFSEIALLVRSMPKLDEATALSVLASTEIIKRAFADPESAMDRLMHIISQIDGKSGELDSLFCMRLLGKMLSNASFVDSWLYARNLDNITIIATLIGAKTSCDAEFDAKCAMLGVFSNPAFYPSVIDGSCIMLYRTHGYGSYLAARMLDGMLSNPNFGQEWLSLASVMKVADFAESMNNRKLGSMKFDYFDGAASHVANPLTRIDPEMGVLYTILNSLPNAHGMK